MYLCICAICTAINVLVICSFMYTLGHCLVIHYTTLHTIYIHIYLHSHTFIYIHPHPYPYVHTQISYGNTNRRRYIRPSSSKGLSSKGYYQYNSMYNSSSPSPSLSMNIQGSTYIIYIYIYIFAHICWYYVVG